MSVLDSFRLDGKVAVVTGASRNVGLAIARAFAEAGATLVLSARGQAGLDAAAAAIAGETGARVETVAADVGVAADVARLVDAVHRHFDQADVLVNNAFADGGTIGTDILDIADEAWDVSYRVNMLAPFRLVRALAPRMIAGRGGSVINLVSGIGLVPARQLAPYGVTKAGLWSLTRYLATELAPKIRVNALMPGMVRDGSAGWDDANETVRRLVEATPLGRFGQPAEVAPAAVYLASDAAAFTTGALLAVNGGRHW